MPRRRLALVGTGHRAEMFIRAATDSHADRVELVALADTNPVRIETHNRWLAQAGHQPLPAYAADDVAGMLSRENVDALIVTSVDRTHADHIVTALDAGRDVITEKPMTVDTSGCRRILDAVARSGRDVSVAFNYRFNPVHETVRTLLAAGEIGEIGSVHFEWLLDVRHGADYFRRWHRDKANSGGLLVHKSGHHFDLVNWWLGAAPVSVYASGRLFFYGSEGLRHGYGGAPFALDLSADPRLKELYLDAVSVDGYRRDQDVFGPGVSIEDDMSVLVRYDSGATMTYHLTAYAPWEGYRVMFNGSKGRLELEVVENSYAAAGSADTGSAPSGSSSAPSGSSSAPSESAAASGSAFAFAPAEHSATLTLRPFWSPPRQIAMPPHDRDGHGGADKRMTAVLLGGAEDPLHRSATARHGALALLTGLAANRSMQTAAPVRVADLLDLTRR